MSTAESDVAQLLRELRDGQRLQLEHQAQALAMQREQVALVKQQFDRAERLQANAERMQQRGGRALKVIVFGLLPLMAAAIVLLIVRWGQ